MRKLGTENKPHIGIYGACNSGKSTLLNALSGRDGAIVSPLPGTTTDPVKIHMELLDFVPIVAIDTAGIDDTSEIGILRVKKSYETLAWVDAAIVVFAHNQWGEAQDKLMEHIVAEALPFLIVHNRFEKDQPLSLQQKKALEDRFGTLPIEFSPTTPITSLLEAIKKTIPHYAYTTPLLLEGKLQKYNRVLLVCPQDSEAPSGRLILPQVQTIRSILDAEAIATVLQPQQLKHYLNDTPDIDLVVTDSVFFPEVRQAVSNTIPVTTFSIELARIKGDMESYKQGLEQVERLCEGDKILILENCTHQTSCEDIGRIKIPTWLEDYCHKRFCFDVISGLDPLPADLSSYTLAIQCGGCMVTRRQLFVRLRRLKYAGVRVVNYGMLIAKIKKVHTTSGIHEI